MKHTDNYRIEDYILQTKWVDFPPEVQQRAVVCALDLFTALLLGSQGKQHQAGVKICKEYLSGGDIGVVGSKDTYNLLGATIAMGHASNSFDIDDGYNLLRGHPGTSFVAGLLSAALKENVSYKEYLTTLVITYESCIRWGLAMQDHYNYLHSTGTYGAFGTAAGVGRLLGLDRDQLKNALSIADFHAPLTPVMRSVSIPSMNKDGVPYGALVGIMAILDTLSGETGRTHFLEEEQYQHHLDTLGSFYHIMGLYFKPYTCCRWAHQPISICIDLMKRENISWQDVEHVVVNTFDSATKLAKIVPSDTDEAQYNIAYPVASAIVNGDLGFAQIRDEALDDPRVLEMLGRLEFKMDPEMEARFPNERFAWVEMTLKDGRVFKSEPVQADGEAWANVDLEWETRKFNRITAPLLSAEDQKAVLEALTGDLDVSMRDILAVVNKGVC